jgi:excisionase family DNA binding protein
MDTRDAKDTRDRVSGTENIGSIGASASRENEQCSDGGREANGTPGGDLLTVEQAAHLLQLSPSSIRSYIRQGTLKAFRIGGLRKVRIARADLLSLLQPTTQSSTSENA